MDITQAAAILGVIIALGLAVREACKIVASDETLKHYRDPFNQEDEHA